MLEKKFYLEKKELTVENLESYDFSKAQITFFAAGSQIAKEWAPNCCEEKQ